MNRLVYKTNIVKAYLRSQCIGSCERNIAINGLEPRLCLFSTRRDEGQSGSEKKKKKGSEDESSVASKKLSEKANTFIKFAERVRRRKENFPPEVEAEHARIAKEYNRQMFRLKKKFDKDVTLKLWLMNEATDSLPADLKAHAITFDETPMPPNRPFPKYDTPPIKGFKFQEYAKSTEDDESY